MNPSPATWPRQVSATPQGWRWPAAQRRTIAGDRWPTSQQLYQIAGTNPLLDLNFSGTETLNDAITGRNVVTFTRIQATNDGSTYVGANGSIKTAASNEPRFDHDPATGESLGLLVEPARTNRLLNSATLSTQSATVTAALTTLSFYGTGTVTLSGVSTAGPLVGTGDNNRVSLTFTPTAGSLTLTVSGTVTNAQLETGAFSTSYIPTTSATVTRAADVATVPTTDSRIYSTSDFTVISFPFGTAGATSPVRLVGPTIKRTAVFAGNLSQGQINTRTNTGDSWRWRVVGPSFALPNFTANGSVTVDWGDGTVQTLTTSVYTFTNGSGYHDIKFRLNGGTFFRPNINNNATYRDRVIALGPAPVSMKLGAVTGFYGCSNLRAFDATVDVTGGTDLSSAWRSCSSLTSFPLINTAAVTVFGNAWNGCSSLTSFPLINTESGTNFQGAWNGCSSLTSFPLINTESGTNFQSAWQSCSSLTSFPLINTESGTNFQSAWQSCSSLTSFPLINTGAGTSFQSAWFGCSSLTSFPANMFDTTGTLIAAAFTNAFLSCALTATSIENILTSLVTNGQSNITLNLNGGTNANTSTWSTAARSAYVTLISRGWTITQNGTAPT
jgi:hypothetical protein